jgi:hypothetical protein
MIYKSTEGCVRWRTHASTMEAISLIISKSTEGCVLWRIHALAVKTVLIDDFWVSSDSVFVDDSESMVAVCTDESVRFVKPDKKFSLWPTNIRKNWRI